MVFDGRYKSIVYQGHDLAELFDHAQDAEEHHNLWLDDINAGKIPAKRSAEPLPSVAPNVGPATPQA